MPFPEHVSLFRFLSAVLFSLLLSGALAPASAQQVLVGPADTVRVTNGGVWHLQGGTMDFGGVDTTAALVERGSARVTGGRLTARRALNDPKTADVAGLGATLTASPNLGEVTIIRGHTVQTAANGNESIARYYDIEPGMNNNSLSATLTFQYEHAEVPDRFSESNLVLFKRTNGTWEPKGASSRNTTANTVTLSGISSFSRWTLGSSSDPLPVEMTRFEGTRTNEGVQLRWRTASETGNAGYEVQRKRGPVKPSRRDGSTADGRGVNASTEEDWQTVGHVDGVGTTNQAQRYRFTDTDLPYAADTLAYRLRQVDADGSAAVTDPVVVARSGVKQLHLKETFPNPARSRVTVRYAVPEGTEATAVTMRLYDLLGRQVHTVVGEATAGRHEQQLSVADLASGVYFLRLQAGTRTQTQKLTVTQ